MADLARGATGSPEARPPAGRDNWLFVAVVGSMLAVLVAMVGVGFGLRAIHGRGRCRRLGPRGDGRGDHLRDRAGRPRPCTTSATACTGRSSSIRPDERRGGAQALDLQPSQGGFVELTFDEAGLYPIVTHKFANVGKGALGVFQAGDVQGAARH